MRNTDDRRPIPAALRAVFDNNWFYVACIELWGIYVRLPLPHLPTYLYLPPLFALCYVAFFAVELIRIKKCIRNGECGAESEREQETQVSRKAFMDGLARTLTSKLSYLIAAVCTLPPYWLAEYYYGRYPFAIVVKGAVMIISFGAIFAFLAYRKAQKM